MSDPFLGVPGDVATELGKVVIAAGRLEAVAQDVAEALNIDWPDVQRKQFAALSKAIVTKVRTHGLPPWARISSSAIEEWAANASERMAARDRLLHSTWFAKAQADHSWTAHRRQLRTRAAVAMDMAVLQQLIADLAGAMRAGMDIQVNLLLEVRSGVYLKNFFRPGEDGTILQEVDGKYPTRPTSEEVAEFVATLSAGSASLIAQGLASNGPAPSLP